MKPLAQDIVREIVSELYEQKVLSNRMRPLYVERLLARLLGGNWKCVGGDWSGWDLEDAGGLRIEIKQSAARQTWTDGPTRKGNATKPIFDIEERAGVRTWRRPCRHWCRILSACLAPAPRDIERAVNLQFFERANAGA